MKEVARSNNSVFLSWLQAVLNDAGIENVIFDTHTALVEGSITAIEKRLMVSDDDYAEALALVKSAERDFSEEYESDECNKDEDS